MAKSKKEKILSIQEQIKELEKKQKEIEEKLYKDTGQLVTREWNCEDDQLLSIIIKELTPQAKVLITKYSNDVTDTDSLNNEESNNEGQTYQTITN
jgi:hypothetical protein